MRRLVTVVGALFFVSAVGWAIWLFVPVFFPSNAIRFSGEMARIDGDIISGRLHQAEEELHHLPNNLSALAWLSFLKRSTEVSRRSGDWLPTLSLAEMSVAQFPGNQLLNAFRVWVALKAGQPERAAGWASSLVGTKWESFWVQAKIESQKDATNASESDTWYHLKEEFSLPQSVPLTFYTEVVTPNSDANLVKDAIISALSQNHFDKARLFLDQLSDVSSPKTPFKQFGALMAVNAGQWSQARSSLVGADDRLSRFLLVDVFLRSGNLSGAKVILDTILQTDQRPLPASIYWDRSALALDDHNLSLAANVLQQARVDGAFSESRSEQGRLLEWRLRFESGDSETVLNAMNKVIADAKQEGGSPFSVETELLRMSLWPRYFSVTRLWGLFHEFPSNAGLVERLAWSLMDQGNWRQSERVLQDFIQRTPGADVWWVWYDRGISAAHGKEFDLAWSDFQKVDLNKRDCYFHYNRGLVALLAAQVDVREKRKDWLEKAGREFSESLDNLPSSGNHVFQSAILSHRAEASLALVSLLVPSLATPAHDQAMLDLHNATVLDPENIQAAFLLRRFSPQKENFHD